MVLEKLMPQEISAYGYEDMQSTVSRIHTFDFIGSEPIGAPFDPDGIERFYRIDNKWHVKVQVVRNEDASWGHFWWESAHLVTPEGKNIKGNAGKVPDDVMALLKAYLEPPIKPSPGEQPQPR